MKKIFAVMLAFLAVACQPAPEAYVPEPIRFAALGQIRMNVAEIRLVESYKSSGKSPNVEQNFPMPPAAAIKQWVSDRLVASGQNGILEITIDNASVKELALPKNEGIDGMFTNDQEARYDALVHVTYRLYTGNQGLSDASGEVVVTRSRSIAEGATVDERQKFFHDLTREIMVQFNTESEKRFQQYFGAFVK